MGLEVFGFAHSCRLCHVMLSYLFFSVCNVALNRPSSRSSVFGPNGYWDSHFANDGITNITGRSDSLFCTHSQKETNPWWAVDLGVPLSVKEIFFTNRLRCRKYSLRNLPQFQTRRLQLDTTVSNSDVRVRPLATAAKA